MQFPDSELWDFSLQTYRIPDVEQACLDLQNTCSADVNIILYCCWCGDKTILLSREDIELLISIACPWQTSILKPLRKARRMMKQRIVTLPDKIHEQTVSHMIEMELHAEHMAQLALENAMELEQKGVANDSSAPKVTAANLALYLEQLEDVVSVGDVSGELTQLLVAIYQDTEAVRKALATA